MNIKEARTQAGLTQKALSDMLGIPKRNIENWEGDKRKCPEWCEQLIVEKILNLSPVKIDCNTLSKALANMLHREIIEDAHVKYNISQEDMEIMNRTAVNKAKIFIDLMNDKRKLKAFEKLYSLAVNSEWNNPVEDEKTQEIKDCISYTAETGKLF